MATNQSGAEWDELLGPFLTESTVAERLRVSRQALSERAARREVWRLVTSDGVDVYPARQFCGEGVLPGLSELLALFPHGEVDDWTIAAWLCTPDLDLGDVPWDSLVRGDFERLLPIARTAARCLTG
jgi:hypothetical protein